MKKFVKLFTALAAAACLFASCSDSFNVKANTDKAYIKIVSENYARTIMPENLNKEDLMYELWGKSKEAKIYEKLGSWVSYTKMMASPAIEINVATWEFTLKAFKDNTQILEDTIEKEITFGSNSLSFELEEVVGYGDIEYTFVFPNPKGIAKAKIKTTLYEENGSTVADSEKEQTVNETVYLENGVLYSSVDYSKKNVLNGFYILTLAIYVDDVLKDTYTTSFKVSTGSESNGREIIKGVDYEKATTAETVPVLSSSETKMWWTEYSDAVEYEIYQYEKGGDKNNAVLYKTTTEAFIPLEELEDSHLYNVKVIYKDGSRSDYFKYSLYEAAAPAISIDGTNVKWTPHNLGDGKYIIYKSSNKDMSDWEVVEELTYTTTTYSMNKLEDNTYYVVRFWYYSMYSLSSAVFGKGLGDVEVSWSVDTNGTYKFTDSNNVWTSNNNGVSSSTASTTWKINLTSSASVTIPWSVSCEATYDKLTITLDSDTVVNQSGVVGGNITKELAKGSHTLTAKYIKDGSNDKNGDKATVTLNPVTCIGTVLKIYN